MIKNGLSNTSYTVKEIEIILENANTSHEAYPGGVDRLNIDLRIAASKADSEISMLVDSLRFIQLLKQIFATHISDAELKLDNIEKFLAKFKPLIADNIVTSQVQNEAVTKSENISPIQQNVHWANYQISTRQDVDLLLEKIFIYF